ncbi:MAG: hypothetical protein JKX69_08355 [Rhodobacteraceae bacterium]|nr:hypothetical protein [Paracoccaceae bacterium]
MKKLALSIAAAVSLFMSFALPARADYNQLFAEALEICLNSYPDMGEIRRNARSAGFRSVGQRQGTDFFTSAGDRVIMMVNASNSDRSCGLGQNRLRGQNAVDSVQQILANTVGDRAHPIDVSDSRVFIAGWFVENGNAGYVVAVRWQINIQGFFTGSLVVVLDGDE